MHPPIRTKLILAFLITVLLPLIGTGLYGNWTTSRTLQTQALDNAQADLHLRALQIDGDLKNVRENILFLSQLATLQTLLNENSPSPETRAAVETDFVAFTVTHPDIFQTRYLDQTGMEIVRVEAAETGIRSLPAEELQNKSSRYYFTATMALKSGDVFVSPLDLNREHDALQMPYTPTIRYATPLFRRNGEAAGVVIINLYAAPFLHYTQTGPGQEAILALVDREGYYLSHPDPAQLWGSPRDLNTGANLSADVPEAWEAIEQTPAGVFTPPPQSWLAGVWEELLPVGLLPGLDSAQNPRRVIVYQTVSPHGEAGPQWILVQDFQHTTLFASIWAFRLTATLILFAAAITALVMAASLARGLANPITALTRDVRQFVQTRLGTGLPEPESAPASSQKTGRDFRSFGERHFKSAWISNFGSLASRKVGRIPPRDEIRELMGAFQEMSTVIDSHLEQLTLLNRAGHHIAARLERPAVLDAACFAAEKLLPVAYLSIRLGDEVIHTCGDPAWEVHRESKTVMAVLEAALQGADWRTAGLSSEEGPAGFLCCASLCVNGEIGLIEIYGPDPLLGKPSSGDLLATLATQISISLDNADLYARLQHRKTELQALVKQLITAQEEERRVVAYDIHDGLIQMLVGARLHLRNFEADRDQTPARAEAALQKGLDELGAAIVEARRVIEGLRPAMLDDLGLVTTLREIAEETRTSCQCELDFHVEPPTLRVPPLLEITAFRIAQEALTNVRKYAHTPRLHLALALEPDCLTVEVRDWGRGFDPARQAAPASPDARGMGLIGMQERARLVGGECVIESEPGKGTRVRAVLPLASQEAWDE